MNGADRLARSRVGDLVAHGAERAWHASTSRFFPQFGSQESPRHDRGRIENGTYLDDPGVIASIEAELAKK